MIRQAQVVRETGNVERMARYRFQSLKPSSQRNWEVTRLQAETQTR